MLTIPPEREIESGIDLLLDRQPISIKTYRMTLKERVERENNGFSRKGFCSIDYLPIERSDIF